MRELEAAKRVGRSRIGRQPRYTQRRLTVNVIAAAIAALSVPLVSILANVAVLGVSTQAAGAATAHTSAYCSLFTTYSKDASGAFGKLSTPGSAETAMKNAFSTLKSEEPKILGVVPSSLKSSYQAVFNAFNQMYGYLQKANYNFLKLGTATEKEFENLSKSLESASAKITAYNKTVCGVKT